MAWTSGEIYAGSDVVKTECSASSELSGTYPATKAFDGVDIADVDDCWISSASNTPEVDGSCYLEWHFTTRHLVGGIQLRRRNSSGASETTNFPKDIVVKVRNEDEVDWETVKTASLDSPIDGAWCSEVVFSKVRHADYLRLEIHSAHYRGLTNWYVAVKEVRFRAWDSLMEVGECKRADILEGTIVNEFYNHDGGNDRSWGYVGADSATRFFMQWREHDRYSDISSIEFKRPAPEYFEILEDGYNYKGAGYLLRTFPVAELDGKWAAWKVSAYNADYADFYIRIWDGSYNYTSDVDFPQSASMLTKGAGVLQTLYSRTSGSAEATASGKAQLNLSGCTTGYVTLFVEFLKNGEATFNRMRIYYLNISDAPIVDAAEGSVVMSFPVAYGLDDSATGEGVLPVPIPIGTTSDAYGIAVLPAAKPERCMIDGAAVLPVPRFSAVSPILAVGNAALPIPSMVGNLAATATATLPTPNFEGAGVVGRVARISAVLPVPRAIGHVAAIGEARLPIGLSGFTHVGILSTGRATLPAPKCSGSATARNTLIGAVVLPISGPAGRASVSLLFKGSAKIRIRNLGEASIGISATGAATLPMAGPIGHGYAAGQATHTAMLPVPLPWKQAATTVSSSADIGLIKYHRGV